MGVVGEVLITNIVSLSPSSFSPLSGMMWALFLLYGEVGVNLFGGRVWVNRTELLDTPYGEANYWPNSFNDFPSAFITLFELLVVNNWYADHGASMGSLWGHGASMGLHMKESYTQSYTMLWVIL